MEDYGYRLYKSMFAPNGTSDSVMPDYMVTALDLTVEDHLVMQAACQKYVDSSISKTVNCPKDMSFQDFAKVYYRAYELGLKGCTTYKPSETRGAVLTTKVSETFSVDPKEIGITEPETGPHVYKLPRPDMLYGMTYKIRWLNVDAPFYLTFNYYVDSDGRKQPFEMFMNGKSVKHAEWIAGVTRLVSAVFRRGGDVRFLVEELEQVASPAGGQWLKDRYIPSLVAMIGHTLAKFLRDIDVLADGEIIAPTPLPEDGKVEESERTGMIEVVAYSGRETKGPGEICPKCNSPTLVPKEGCEVCMSCGYSTCG